MNEPTGTREHALSAFTDEELVNELRGRRAIRDADLAGEWGRYQAWVNEHAGHGFCRGDGDPDTLPLVCPKCNSSACLPHGLYKAAMNHPRGAVQYAGSKQA